MKFVNAYNFISTPIERAGAYGDKDEHTGYIEYTITTRSPLFIPNTTSESAFPKYRYNADEKNKVHKSYDFYSYSILNKSNDYEESAHEPVIPGSEIRGAIRNLYETLTDSCMGVLNEKLIPVKRTMEVFSPGLLEKKNDGTYALREAEDVIFHVLDKVIGKKRIYKRIFDDNKYLPYDQYDEGTLVYFKKKERKAPNGSPIKSDTNEVHLTKMADDNASGYLIRGESDESLGKKKNCHIFIPGRTVKISIGENELDSLDAVLDSYRSEPQKENSYSHYRNRFHEFRRKELDSKSKSLYFPVYYSRVDDYIYLAPASITKERAHRSIGKLAGNFKPCNYRDEMCPACSLFGMAGKDNEQAVASKIRFSDVRLNDGHSVNDCYDPIVTLQILSSPKISNSEFYLNRPENADFWTYDYKIVNGKAVKYGEDEVLLRGRKYYWHVPEVKLPTSIPRSDQNKTIRPVKSNVSFSGKMYFNRISQKQLNQMIWILNGGNPEDQIGKGEIGYKIGGGKPLGLGSITCKITSVVERKISIENGILKYNFELLETKPQIYENVGFSSTIKNEFLAICSIDAMKDKVVTYPVTDAQLESGGTLTEGYRWFVNNHPNNTKRYLRTYMKISETLPTIMELIPSNSDKSSDTNQTETIKPLRGELVEGQDYAVRVLEISGIKVRFVTPTGHYFNIKAGNDGLEAYNRKNIKELLDENIEIVARCNKNEESDKYNWRIVEIKP